MSSIGVASAPIAAAALRRHLRAFRDFRKPTRERLLQISDCDVPVFFNEFWTSKQRAACSLHEVSYRACFKPQLPRFFIERLTKPGDVVYDPFMGRGTTLLEAALLGRIPIGCDANPLSELLVRPRLEPPSIAEVEERLGAISFSSARVLPDELLAFYHPETLRSIVSLRSYLLRKRKSGELDEVDRWIWMVALNRLTGHSPGFFSVYTLPPNQAVSVRAQLRINRERKQTPERRDVAKLILRKTKRLLKDVDPLTARTLRRSGQRAKLVVSQCDRTPELRSRSVQLIVTSPPFLDIVNYMQDNWLRGWFGGINLRRVPVWQYRRLPDWERGMRFAFQEMRRVLAVGGHIAFEVGEVRNGSVRLEEAALRAGIEAGLDPVLILINEQRFTKTSNCWGIENSKRGTNTNRVVLFRKSG